MLFTGSAPISSEILDFLKSTFGTRLLESYGMTELCGCAITQNVRDGTSGFIGAPSCTTDVKLLDVPEMNYTTENVVDGVALPEGEICIRGLIVMPGYFKDEAKTREAIGEGGWIRTGDIGRVYPSGKIKIIDRRKDIFKLQQGEYVAPAKLENIFVAGALV